MVEGALQPHPRLRRDLEHLGPSLEPRKGGRVGAGEERLAAEARERVEERRPAPGVEMRGDFVEERNRRDAGHFGDEPRMRQHQPDEERLLLAGRGARGRRVLRSVADGEIAEMRANERAPGGGVAGAIGA